MTGERPTVEVPPTALKLVGQLLGAMSEGRPVMLVPDERELTTVEAANFLIASRPFVIKEIESGRLPHRKVGSHRHSGRTEKPYAFESVDQLLDDFLRDVARWKEK